MCEVFKDINFVTKSLQNNTSLDDEAIREISQKVLKSIFSGIVNMPYRDYCGSIRIGIFDLDSSVKDDTPFFETHFISNPDGVVKLEDLNTLDAEDILQVSFDVIETDSFGVYLSFGLIELMLLCKLPCGEVDNAMVRAINRDIANNLKEAFNKDVYCFNVAVKSGFAQV